MAIERKDAAKYGSNALKNLVSALNEAGTLGWYASNINLLKEVVEAYSGESISIPGFDEEEE